MKKKTYSHTNMKTKSVYELKEEITPKMAELEVAILKESNREFLLYKQLFNPRLSEKCFYGQIFGCSYKKLAHEFKKDNNITIIEKTHSITYLERFLSILWSEGKKEQVYKIVEQFATWKEDEEVVDENNLFTY